MGSIGSTSVTLQPLTFSGNYKGATQEMKDFVAEIVNNMRKEFSILSVPIEIEFSRGTDGAGGFALENKIILNGTWFKKAMTDDFYTTWAKNLTAHEMTHIMQDRINSASGIYGKDNRDRNIERIWNNAVSRCIKDHPEWTEKQVNSEVAKSYKSGGVVKRIGRTPVEKMAVSIGSLHSDWDTSKFTRAMGKYVAEELKKEMKGLTYTPRRKK